MHFNLLVIYLLANVQLNQPASQPMIQSVLTKPSLDLNVCSNLKQPQQFVIAATNFFPLHCSKFTEITMDLSNVKHLSIQMTAFGFQFKWWGECVNKIICEKAANTIVPEIMCVSSVYVLDVYDTINTMEIYIRKYRDTQIQSINFG